MIDVDVQVCVTNASHLNFLFLVALSDYAFHAIKISKIEQMNNLSSLYLYIPFIPHHMGLQIS